MDIIQISGCEEIDIRINQLYLVHDMSLSFQHRIYHLFDDSDSPEEDLKTMELLSA
jgi:hypothetical protein